MDKLGTWKDMNIRPKLAICIPTYNNPDYIKDILMEEFPYYEPNNMDLYIMDSSDNNQTEDIFREYKLNSQNLYYYRFPSEIHSNKKVYMTFQMAGKEILCDYMWIRSDATRASETLLNALPSYLSNGYDFIVISYEGLYPKGIWETDSPQMIFDEYCWRLCLYGASILNTKRMLLAADWAFLEGKYLCTERINFSHLTFYFEQILRIENFRALVMGIPRILYHLTEKKKRSAWHRDIFKIWLKFWPGAVESLPEMYKNKLEVIRDFGVNVHYYYMPMLRELAADGILTPKVYEKYKERIVKYSNMPLENFYDAAYGRPSEHDGIGQEAFFYPICLEWFKRNYKKRYIYGCGKFAKSCADILREYAISFEAFVVSSREESEKLQCVMEHDVVALDDCHFEKGCGIWLCMKLDYQKEVIELLRRKRLLRYVFRFHDDYAYITNLVETVRCHALSKEMEEWT